VANNDANLEVLGVTVPGGNATLSTGGGGNLNLTGNVQASDVITLNPAGDLLDNGGRILGSQLTGTAGGAATIDMEVDTFGYTAGGNIVVDSTRGFAMNAVNAGANDVTIMTTGGITDNNADTLNITANDLAILAETEIGAITDFSEGLGDPIEVNVGNQVNQLEITEAGGSIFIDLGTSTPTFGGTGIDPDGDGHPVYYPRDGQQIPYVYFHHDSYATIKYGDGTNELAVGGVARPYQRDGGTEFINKDSYQIISAGQDGDWGPDNANKQFPSGVNYGDGDNDNITNFSEGTLGDQIP